MLDCAMRKQAERLKVKLDCSSEHVTCGLPMTDMLVE